MPKLQYKFEVDWDHDLLYANANSNITAQVPTTKPWSWNVGKPGGLTLASKHRAGKLTLPLLNINGLFSSFNTSGALFGLILPGRRCRVQLGSRAAQMVRANSESLSIADNTALSTGDVDWCVAGRFYLDTKDTDRGLVSKWVASGNQREFQVRYQSSSDRIRLVVSNDGTATNGLGDTKFGSPPLATWFWVVVWHDATANTINMSIDDGDVDSKAHTTGTFDSTALFSIGSLGTGTYHDGRAQSVVMWKGSGAVPSAAELTWMYNNGNGRVYDDFGRTGDGSDLKTAMVGYWECDEESGTRVDAHGSNDLTDNNTVLAADGVTNYLSWSGRLDSIVPAATLFEIPSATLTAFGNFATMAAGKPRTDRETDILTSAAMDVILDDIGWPASSTGARDINTGQTTMSYWFFSSAQATNAVREAFKVEDTEFGVFRESERDDLVFEDRHFRLSGSRLVSQKTYADDGSAGSITYQSIPQRDPVKDVFNRITAETPVQSLAALATLWTLDANGANSPLIGPGETVRFIASHPGPSSPTQDIGAVWTTLVATTDYTANTASDDSGTDLVGSMTIALTKALDIMVISVTNSHATLSAYLTLLQARGQAIQAGAFQKIEEFDQDSIDAYGDREYLLPGKFLPTIAEATDQARYALALNKDIHAQMSVSYLASKDVAHAKEAGLRRLSNKITVISDAATKLGISSEPMFVEGIEHRVLEYSHIVTLILSHAEQVARGIVLDTGPGLDTGVLAY